jgi:alkylhydroperoxidase/carboxymuconolactone decarboxylase family protein YurZ
MRKLPKAFETFRKRYRSVYKAYEALGGAAHEATPEEIEHVVLLAITTSGFPTAVAAFTWVEELLAPRKRKTSRKI